MRTKENGISQVDSRVKTSRKLVKDKVSTTKMEQLHGQVFGLRCGRQLGYYDHDTLSLKMLEQSLFENSPSFLLRLPKSGMMRNGKIYAQATWAVATGAREYGLSATLRTPDANMERGSRSDENLQGRIDRGMPLNLNDQLAGIQKGMLKTPSAKKNPRFGDSGNLAQEFEGGFIEQRFLPTPKARDRKGSNNGSERGYGSDISDFININLPTPSASSFDSTRPNKKGGAKIRDIFNDVFDNEETNATDTESVQRDGFDDNKRECERPQEIPEFRNSGWQSFDERGIIKSENWVEVATAFCRVDDVIPRRVERLKGLGNAIVPQIAQMIWRLID